jgi:hypothetical protein
MKVVMIRDIRWIARRSYSKPTFPGKLDNIVGGGLSKGTVNLLSGTPLANAIKECKEEGRKNSIPASIPDKLLKALNPCGAVMFWLALFN